MTDKMNRKELKEPDGFTKLSARFFQLLVVNKKRLLYSGVAIVVLLVFGLMYNEYSRKRENNASFALALAQESLKKSEGKLNPESKKLFNKVIKDFGSTFSGLSAKIELADLYFQDKKYEKAYELFMQVNQKSGVKLLKVISLINLAYIKEIQKDYKTALSYFKEMLNYKIEVFDLQAYFGMSRCLEKLHKLDEARSIYNKIISKFPNSEHAKMAKQYLPSLEN